MGTSALEPGTTVGRYVIEHAVGAGGMGEVHAARDPELKRQVAIKILRADERSPPALRLLREAQAIARLSHPNVVQVYEIGHAEGRLFIAMELLHGITLRQWMAETRPPEEVIACLRSAGRGLAAAHRAGIVHRDFKPDNVIVDGSRVKVLDFGLARASTSSSDPGPDSDVAPPSTDTLGATMTARGTVVGTPGYMAPEQHRGATA